MPGFTIGRTGGHRSASSGQIQYYYNYFWDIPKLFDTGSLLRGAITALRDATLPVFITNTEKHVGSSLEYKFAKSVSWDDVKVTWYDTLGMLPILKEWRNSVWTPECGIADANTYKRQSLIDYYLPTGKGVNTWTLHNSWPSQIRSGELTYTASDVKLVEVTVTYDWATEEEQSI